MSRPVPQGRLVGGRHSFTFNRSSGKTIELLPDLEGTNVVHKSRSRSIENTQYIGNLKGPLIVSVDKEAFDMAYLNVKGRFHARKYSATDSNRIIIELFKESGRPLSDEELQGLGITNYFGYWGVVVETSPLHQILFGVSQKVAPRVDRLPYYHLLPDFPTLRSLSLIQRRPEKSERRAARRPICDDSPVD